MLTTSSPRPTLAGRALRALLLCSFLWSLCFVGLPAAATLAATAAAPTPITTGVPRFEAAPCVYPPAEGVVEGKTVRCGWVVVATKHANPTGPTIRIPVMVYSSLSATPAPEPIMMLTGGPGQSGKVFTEVMTTKAPLDTFYKAIVANNDVIVFDQRGTGKSQPALQCDQMAGLTVNGQFLQAFADSPAVVAMTRCRDKLTAAGVDLTAYTTSENAADVNDIRLALGYSGMNLFGASYGSELGLAINRDFGQFVRATSVSSIAPINTPWYFEIPRSFDTTLKAFFNDCAANAACNASWPNLQATFQSTVATLNKTPYPLKLTDPTTGKVEQFPLDGATYTSVLFQLFYVTSILPYMPDMLTRSAQGNFFWLETLLPVFLASSDDPMAMGMHFSVVCSKDPSKAAYEAALAYDESILPEVRAALQQQTRDYYQICQVWPSLKGDPKGTTPASGNGAIALINGQLDPITPPRYGAIAKETLPAAVNVTLPGGGHSAMLPTEAVGACGFVIAMTNIYTPGKPDTSCVGTLKTNYRKLPPQLAGPDPSPVPTPSPVPSPPPTGNGGALPGLPNTGAGGGNSQLDGWLLALAFLACGLVAVPVAARLRRRTR